MILAVFHVELYALTIQTLFPKSEQMRILHERQRKKTVHASSDGKPYSVAIWFNFNLMPYIM